MCDELSYQIINISAVNHAVFCYYQKFAKIIIAKKISVGGSEQRRDALGWTHLRGTLLELFRLL